MADETVQVIDGPVMARMAALDYARSMVDEDDSNSIVQVDHTSSRMKEAVETYYRRYLNCEVHAVLGSGPGRWRHRIVITRMEPNIPLEPPGLGGKIREYPESFVINWDRVEGGPPRGTTILKEFVIGGRRAFDSYGESASDALPDDPPPEPPTAPDNPARMIEL